MTDLLQTIENICKVGAQRAGAKLGVAIACDDCGAPATETWSVPIPPFAEHYCESCADRRRDRYYEGPQDAPDVPARAEND